MANVTIAKEGLGLPNTYKQSFEILHKHSVISKESCQKWCSMVGFRNISVHDYEEIKPAIVHSIVKNNLKDFEDFYTVVLIRANSWNYLFTYSSRELEPEASCVSSVGCSLGAR